MNEGYSNGESSAGGTSTVTTAVVVPTAEAAIDSAPGRSDTHSTLFGCPDRMGELKKYARTPVVAGSAAAHDSSRIPVMTSGPGPGRRSAHALPVADALEDADGAGGLGSVTVAQPERSDSAHAQVTRRRTSKVRMTP